MHDDHNVDKAEASGRDRPGADVSAWAGVGVIVTIASLAVSRIWTGSVAAAVLGFVPLVPFGVAIGIAIRRRAVRAVLLPLLMFVLTATLGVARVT